MLGEVYWLRAIVSSCQLISEYVAGAAADSFDDDDPMRRDAVLYRLGVIGESVPHVTPATRALLPDVPWSTIRNMRNLVLHEFHRVDLGVVWDTASRDVPVLLARLETIVRPEE
jgi:uncharacterized protein with HEPN domain